MGRSDSLRPPGRCPHSMVQFCPLYVAAHDARLARFGCDDGRLDEHKGCAVDRGMDYGKAAAAIALSDPQMCAEIAWEEKKEMNARQRARNMRLLGVH